MSPWNRFYVPLSRSRWRNGRRGHRGRWGYCWLCGCRWVGGNSKFPIRGNRKPHTLVVGGLCPAFHDVGESNSEGAGGKCTDGNEDAAEALSATGRLEGRVGETLRGEPPDDPRMGRDGSVEPGPVVRGWVILATSSRAPQAGSLHRDRRGTSRGVPRSVGDDHLVAD